MENSQLTDQRLTEIREALQHTDWRRFDREDVKKLVHEVDRLRAELRRATGAAE